MFLIWIAYLGAGVMINNDQNWLMISGVLVRSKANKYIGQGRRNTKKTAATRGCINKGWKRGCLLSEDKGVFDLETNRLAMEDKLLWEAVDGNNENNDFLLFQIIYWRLVPDSSNDSVERIKFNSWRKIKNRVNPLPASRAKPLLDSACGLALFSISTQSLIAPTFTTPPKNVASNRVP